MSFFSLFFLSVLSFTGCCVFLAAPLFLLLLLLNCTPVLSQNGSVNGFISFAVTQVVVDENTGGLFTTVRLPLVREVGSSGNVIATVTVSITDLCHATMNHCDCEYN